MFLFNGIIEYFGFNPRTARILRHDQEGVAAWQRGRHDAFGCFASFQRLDRPPYAEANVAFHFLPGPPTAEGDATGTFVGATRILDSWPWDGERLPQLEDELIIRAENRFEGVEAFDLEWVQETLDLAERILIRWGPPAAARAWTQWAGRNEKEILEYRQTPNETPFPGFASFAARTSQVRHLSASWRAALSSVGGIYLLVADNGDQYVGSATGQDGFLGRWRQYAANGHGGNVLLRREGHQDYGVSILEVASPDMSHQDILNRERFWKNKLGVRAHGLNAN